MKITAETAALFGRKGGQATSPAKRRAAQANGRKRRKPPALFSSRSEEWRTPPDLFAALSAEFGGFDLDPCATQENALCPSFYTREDDGLAKPWSGQVFVNPPYGATVGRWIKKAWEAAQGGPWSCAWFRPGRIRPGGTSTPSRARSASFGAGSASLARRPAPRSPRRW